MRAALSLLTPFDGTEAISPLPVTTWLDVTLVVFVTVFFSGPFGDGVAFVTVVVVVVFFTGDNRLAAVVVVVRDVVVVVIADVGRLDVVVVVVVEDRPPATVVRMVLVFDTTFDAGLCCAGKIGKYSEYAR